MDYKKYLTSYLFPIITGLLVMIGAISCSDDNDVQQSQYGYVQFTLHKSASYSEEPTLRSVTQLNRLNDAKKVEVVLQHAGSTISQSLVLNSYNAENAEFGLRSNKLELLAGEYVILGFRLYDSLDQLLLSGEVEDNKFTVIPAGLTSKALPIDCLERGMVSFKLVKEIAKVRATADNAYPFGNIKLIDISVKNTFTQEITQFDSIPVAYTESFHTGSLDETLYPDENAETAYGECDTILWLKAGTYKINSYITYSDTKGKNVLEVANVTSQKTFKVDDNQLTEEVEVPIAMTEAAEYIKDYVALKEIWEALDGPNWSYAGISEAKGCNWNFNKDIDMWGEQPGVSLHSDGRVAAIVLDDFGAKGCVPDAIGQLTQLQTLQLGSHSEVLGGHVIENINANMTAEQKMAVRMDYDNLVLAKDFREGFSEMMQMTINMDPDEKPIQKSRLSLKAIQYGDLTNAITGISKAVMHIQGLERFYIANSPITAEGFFRDIDPESPYYSDTLNWKNHNTLYDLEIYNCPNLTSLPTDMLANLPELQMLNIACNKGISGEQLKADWETIIEGNSGSKLQVLYMGYNNLKEFPEYEYLKKMTRLNLLDCVSNKIQKLHPFGKEINFSKIYLDYNEITEIPNIDGYFCGYAGDFESFTCTHNKLTKFPDIFNGKSIYVIGSIDFSNNQISEFENGENHKGINASQVNLGANKLTTFPSILFKTSSPITYLILSENGMTDFPKGSLEGDYTYMLQALDLSFNKLKKLPSDFTARKLPYLSGLDLNYNSFSEFPYEPLGISTLQRFFIRNQRDENGNRCLKEWPTGLYTCPSLVYFCIGSNDLRKIEDTISPYILYFEIKDNPNISIDLSSVCNYIQAGYYTLIYDKTQDIRGCDYLDLEK